MADVENAIRTIVGLSAEFSGRHIPSGSYGTIVEKYDRPEGYAVDVVVSRTDLVGGYSFENVILTPDQFEIVPEIPDSIFEQFDKSRESGNQT
jgi:hypothetical protein